MTVSTKIVVVALTHLRMYVLLGKWIIKNAVRPPVFFINYQRIVKMDGVLRKVLAFIDCKNKN